MRFIHIDEFIAYTIARMSKGRFGLDHFTRAMASLQNPQLQLKVIHVAGTNGKGSTTNYLRSIYQTEGYNVGSFTSPHLEVHNDRIRINDVFISDEDLLRLGNQFYELIEQYELSMFEIDMLIAVMYFLENNVDLVIFEVGLGGRLDATNIVDPMVSVITTIGFDHMEYLGNTLEAISFEKAGIIKPTRPVFTGERKEECLKVFKEVAKKNQSLFVLVDEATEVKLTPLLSFKACGLEIHLDTLALYQVQNANLALNVAVYLNDHGFSVRPESMLKGLFTAHWKGRFEVMSKDPLIIVDGAHNEHGMRALVESVQNLAHPRIAVFAALKDKDTQGMLEDLVKNFDHVIVTEFDFYRAQSASELSKQAKVIEIKVPYEAILEGLRLSQQGSLMITGSLYFISDVRQHHVPQLKKEGYLP